LAVASCDSTTAIGGYTVTYRVNSVGAGTLDSAKYDNGTGTMVKVNTPATTWTVNFTVPTGSTVEAHVWGTGTAAGSAKLVAIWMTATGTVAGDSTTAATANTTKFTIDLGPRHL
jgi:hypothetical protein